MGTNSAGKNLWSNEDQTKFSESALDLMSDVDEITTFGSISSAYDGLHRSASCGQGCRTQRRRVPRIRRIFGTREQKDKPGYCARLEEQANTDLRECEPIRAGRRPMK